MSKTNSSPIKALLILLMGFCVLGCQNESKPLRLATYTYWKNDRIDNLKPFADELEKALNRPVQTESYPDVESFIKGIKANEVDVGLINTLGYLLLALDNKNMQPVATLKVKQDAVDNYKTVLLASKDSIADLEALKNNAESLSMMFVTEGSTSGNLVPRLLLSSLGIKSPENDFKEVKYGGNHTSTLDSLLSRGTDLCAIGSNEYFEQIQADSSILISTQLLWISEEIPLGPILLNNDLTEADKDQITQLILNLDESNATALESIKAGWSEAKQAEKFYPITDSYYDNFRKVNGNDTDLAAILEAFAN